MTLALCNILKVFQGLYFVAFPRICTRLSTKISSTTIYILMSVYQLLNAISSYSTSLALVHTLIWLVMFNHHFVPGPKNRFFHVWPEEGSIVKTINNSITDHLHCNSNGIRLHQLVGKESLKLLVTEVERRYFDECW